MKKKQLKSLALHLIKEDLRVHQMIDKCREVDILIEYRPDIASTVKTLLNQDLAGEEWDNNYVQQMIRANALDWEAHATIDALAREVLKALVA